MEVEIMRRRSGFTLIEMMIVLAIIAALSATLVPIAMNALNQSKVTGNLTDVQSIRMAAMQYFYKHGEFPETMSADTFDIYLTWSNLQGDNLVEQTSGDKGYVIEDSATKERSIDVTMQFETEPLANAFLAQWTDIEGQQTHTGPTPNGDYYDIVLTFSFQ